VADDLLKRRCGRSDNPSMAVASVAELPEELQGPLHESLSGEYVRADRVAEARGRLRRGEHPCDEDLARAIVADAAR